MMSFLTLTACHNKLKGLEGHWILNNGTMMIIDDNSFYWYQNYQDTKQNYFYGKNVQILSGIDALNAINVPEENKEELLNTHTYYLSVTYTKWNINGMDISQQLDGNPSEFAFQIDAKDHLAIVNLITNEQFTATRQNK